MSVKQRTNTGTKNLSLCVISILSSKKTLLKREEIVYLTANMLGVSMADVSPSLGTVLTSLKRKGFVENPVPSYWCITACALDTGSKRI